MAQRARRMTVEERREASRRRRLADEAWERKLDDAARQIFASELPEHNKRAVAAEFKAFARQHRANEKKAESRGDIWYRHTPNVDPKQLWRDWATGKPQALLAAPTGRPSLHRGWERSTYRDVKSVRHPREFPGYGRIPKLLEGPKRVLAGVTPWPRHGEPVRDWSTLVKSGRYTVRLSEVAKAWKRDAAFAAGGVAAGGGAAWLGGRELDVRRNQIGFVPRAWNWHDTYYGDSTPPVKWDKGVQPRGAGLGQRKWNKAIRAASRRDLRLETRGRRYRRAKREGERNVVEHGRLVNELRDVAKAYKPLTDAEWDSRALP